MQKGIVKWFDDGKGYGFIVYNEKDEISVRFIVIEGNGFKPLDESQSVEFEVMEDNRELRAVHIKKVDN